MGIEIPAEYGGAQASFTTAIIAIEELAKVDPSVAVMADVHVPYLSSTSNVLEYLSEHRFCQMGLSSAKREVFAAVGNGEIGIVLLI